MFAPYNAFSMKSVADLRSKRYGIQVRLLDVSAAFRTPTYHISQTSAWLGTTSIAAAVEAVPAGPASAQAANTTTFM
jgi:hypothetical protein